ncbi:hypothetical protein [Embleya sp. NBC_00896]|uniref:hypothetical protein n=1 Tax=Embleya sp. NBC_00896 TaxID=2975961 RepID=UPI002F913DBB|nr:hypothetical protein OG928_37605 [Embleya sp. NBC_00896]
MAEERDLTEVGTYEAGTYEAGTYEAGTYVDMASRLTGPVRLALALSAVRGRVKR